MVPEGNPHGKPVRIVAPCSPVEAVEPVHTSDSLPLGVETN
jgi:hypothetical protein